MKNAIKSSAIGFALLVLGAGPAWAHAGDGPQFGFARGMLHFITGWDHVAAIIFAGVMAALFSRKITNALVIMALSAIGFGMYHDVAFYGNQGQVVFDFGFMSAAIILLSMTFMATKVGVSSILKYRGAKNDH